MSQELLSQHAEDTRTIASLILRVAALEAALAPFAACGEVWAKTDDVDKELERVVYWAQRNWNDSSRPDTGINVGDFLDARSALNGEVKDAT